MFGCLVYRQWKWQKRKGQSPHAQCKQSSITPFHFHIDNQKRVVCIVKLFFLITMICKSFAYSRKKIRIDKILVRRFQQNWWLMNNLWEEAFKRKNSYLLPWKEHFNPYAVYPDFRRQTRWAQIFVHRCLQEAEQMVRQSLNISC